MDAILTFLGKTGIVSLFSQPNWWQYLVMYAIIGTLFYLAVVKKFEPLLLLPIAFGMLLANLPAANLMHMDFFFDDYYLSTTEGTLASAVSDFLSRIDANLYTVAENGVVTFGTMVDGTRTPLGADVIASLKDVFQSTELAKSVTFDGALHVKMSTIIKEVVNNGGLVDILYLGVKLGIYPSLIFLGVGAMTDFSPLISNPKSIFLGGAAQLGVFMAFFGALLFGFSPQVASAIGIIGGADGPTAILVTKILAPEYLGPIAIAAYSYMALSPMIQPPIMKLMTTKKERSVVMTTLRPVSKKELVIFPIMVIIVVCLMLPDAAPLVGFLMFGNLLNVSGVTDRLSKTAQNELINIVTIFLGISVGATASAKTFLDGKTLLIILLGLVAFCFSTFGGLLGGKIMYLLSGGKVNPLIGSAGVSAVPMAARVSQKVGQEEVPGNFLLMHAMGPNVAGVIGSAIAAGVFLALYR